MSQIEKRITTALVGIENVYAKHVPLLLRIVASAMKGKLKFDMSADELRHRER